MSDPTDQLLDRMLQDWANARAISAEEQTVLEQRVAQQIANSKVRSIKLPPPKRERWRMVTVGLAAAAMFVSVGAWKFHSRSAVTEQQFSERGPSLDLSQAYWNHERERQHRLLAEYRNVFGADLAWITDSSHGCKVGLVSEDAAKREPEKYVVVHLWLNARNAGRGGSWKQVEAINVVAGCEELVEIPEALGGGNLAVWTHSVDEEWIAIDLSYQPAMAGDSPKESSRLQRVREITKIFDFTHNGVEYQLHQTVDMIRSNDLGSLL